MGRECASDLRNPQKVQEIRTASGFFQSLHSTIVNRPRSLMNTASIGPASVRSSQASGPGSLGMLAAMRRASSVFFPYVASRTGL